MHIALAALSLGLAGPPSRLPAFHTAARAPVARPSVVVAEEYSQSSRLREEVEAPFAKVRLFVWPALMAGAAIATYFAGTSLLAEAVGAREPAPDSLVNLGVDLAAVAAIGTVWRRDLRARDSRLKRLSAGAAMAALRVELGGDAAGVLPLADLSAGRKLPRRVVIVRTHDAVTLARADRDAAKPANSRLVARRAPRLHIRRARLAFERIEQPESLGLGHTLRLADAALNQGEHALEGPLRRCAKLIQRRRVGRRKV